MLTNVMIDLINSRYSKFASGEIFSFEFTSVLVTVI